MQHTRARQPPHSPPALAAAQVKLWRRGQAAGQGCVLRSVPAPADQARLCWTVLASWQSVPICGPGSFTSVPIWGEQGS